MLKDGTGREFNDELTDFFKWYMSKNAPNKLLVPLNHSMVFMDGASGIVLYREPPFQVQLFIVEPNVDIPEHMHPNVDSYEVYLNGMTFTHNGETTSFHEDLKETEDGLPDKSYNYIRVLPNDRHGGKSSDKGGCFISVQHWLNGVVPTTVGDDWKGVPMGPNHTKQIADHEKGLQNNEDKAQAFRVSADNASSW